MARSTKDKLYRDFDHDQSLGFTRRTGTITFESLVPVILNELQVENNEELNPEVIAHIKAKIEAKFKEEDVVLTFNKFIEQKVSSHKYIPIIFIVQLYKCGRKPCLLEFHQFINSWEDKLINENIDFRQENRAIRDEKITIQEEIRALREENRKLRQRYCQN